MSKRIYDYLKINDLKDMLNKTWKLYADRPAFRIKVEEGNKEFLNAQINPKEMSMMLFTSGTTSKSKVVALSHENICTKLWCRDSFYKNK